MHAGGGRAREAERLRTGGSVSNSIRRLAAALLAALLPASASAGSPSPLDLLKESQVRGRLVDYKGFFAEGATGLRIVSYELPGLPRATLGVSFRAGSTDDPPGKEGMAHLVEHLAFRARPGGGARIGDRLEGTGFVVNAETSHDQTVYFGTGKLSQLRQVVAIEAERLADPLAGISEKEFLVERDVVISEIRERRDHNPTVLQVGWLLEVGLAKDHPYRRPIGGTEASLRGITLADVRAWVREHYSPAHAIVVVTSAIPARDAAVLVGDGFGKLFAGAGPEEPRRAPVARDPPPMPHRPAEGPLERREGPVERPTLWMGWFVPGEYSKLTPSAAGATVAIAQALGGSPDLVPLDGATLVLTRFTLTDPSKAEEFLAGRKERLRTLAIAGGLVADWARGALLVSSYLALEDMSDVAAFAQQVRIYGSPDRLGTWRREVGYQMGSRFPSYLSDFLDPERTFALLVLPDRKPVSERDGAPPRGGGETRVEADDAAFLPAIGLAELAQPPGLVNMEKRRLDNGLTVLAARRGSFPAAEVQLIYRTDPEGTVAFPAGVRTLALSSLSDWSSGWTRVASGGTLVTIEGIDHYARVERGTSDNLQLMMKTLSLWARNLKPLDGFDERKASIVKGARRARHRPSVRSNDALVAGLFPGHPAGQAVTPESLERVTEDQVKAWLRRNLRPERATLVVVSDRDPDDRFWKEVEERFGDLSAKGDPQPMFPLASSSSPRERKVVVVDQPSATQPRLRVGVALPPIPERDEVALSVLEKALASRLERQLRVVSGATYSASVSRIDRGNSAAFVASTAVEEAALLPTMKVVLDALAAAPRISADDLDARRASFREARSLGLRFDGVGRSARALQRLVLEGRPDDYWESWPERLVSLDSAKLQAAARSLSLGREVVVVVGSASRLRPVLEGAGYRVEVSPEPPPEPPEEKAKKEDAVVEEWSPFKGS